MPRRWRAAAPGDAAHERRGDVAFCSTYAIASFEGIVSPACSASGSESLHRGEDLVAEEVLIQNSPPSLAARDPSGAGALAGTCR